jgi:hypothetical protein
MSSRFSFQGLVGFLSMVAFLAGCADPAGDFVTLYGPDPDGGGRVSFALTDPGQVYQYFKIRFFRKAPSSLGDSAYFTSGCTAAGPGFAVDSLKTGSGYVVVYEGYTDPGCPTSSLSAVGIRGDVDIVKAGTGNAYYYIQVNQKGALNAFPLPDPVLDPPQGGILCTRNEDCNGLIDCAAGESCPPDGKRYKFHPAAVCDVEGGQVCRLPSLFPLNTRVRRAMPAVVSARSGVVSLIGGFNRADAASMDSFKPEVEQFDPTTSLFSSSLADLPVDTGFAPIVPLGNGSRALVLGGAQKVALRAFGKAWLPVPSVEDCPAAIDCALAFSGKAYVIDLNTSMVTASALPVATALAQAAVVDGDASAGTPVFLRSGLVLDNGAAIAGSKSYLCSAAEDGTVTCKEVEGSSKRTPRAGAAGVCLTDVSGACQDYLVVGGNAADAGPNGFGEVFTSKDGKVVGLKGDASLPATLTGAVAVKAGDRIWTIGGFGSDGGVGAGPMLLAVDTNQGTLSAKQQPDLSQTDLALLLRVGHQATALADGTGILVTGGVGKDFKLVDTAVLVSVDGGKLSVKPKSTWKMNEPRLAHTATLIRGGLLNGAILITGGVTSVESIPEFAHGAEIFLP